MDINSVDEKAIREYLLGVIGAEASEEIEQRVLTDDNFASLVERVEDQIIEDYLDGALSYSAKRAMESHFLRPLERRRQLEFARLLRSHLQKADSQYKSIFSWLWDSPTLRMYGFSGSIAVLLVVSISVGIYAFRLQRALDSEMKTESQLKAQVEQLVRAAELENQSALLQKTVAIMLTHPTTRDIENIPLINLCPERGILEIDVALVDNLSPSYMAILTGPGLDLRRESIKANQGSGILKLYVPADNLSPGEYKLKITGSLPGSIERSYIFRISECS